MYEENNPDLELVKEAARKLGEHFDGVQIFATRHEAGQTCGTCVHLVPTGRDGKFKKCALVRANWTHGPGTDIRCKHDACSFWAPIGLDQPWDSLDPI